MLAGSDRRFERASGAVGEASGDRMVVIDAVGTSISTLNPVGAYIWQQLPARPSELIGTLAREFPHVGPDQMAADIHRFLAELEEAQLVIGHDADG